MAGTVDISDEGNAGCNGDGRRAKELIEHLLREKQSGLYQTAFNFLVSEGGRVGIERGIVDAIEQAERSQVSDETVKQSADGFEDVLDSFSDLNSLEQVIRDIQIRKTVRDINDAARLKEEMLFEQDSLADEKLLEQYRLMIPSTIAGAVERCKNRCAEYITEHMHEIVFIDKAAKKYFEEVLTDKEILIELEKERKLPVTFSDEILREIRHLSQIEFEDIFSRKSVQLRDDGRFEPVTQQVAYALQPKLNEAVDKCVSGIYSNICIQYTTQQPSDVQEGGSKSLADVLRGVITDFGEGDVVKVVNEQFREFSDLFADQSVLTKYLRAQAVQRVVEGLTTAEITSLANRLKAGRDESYTEMAQQLNELLRRNGNSYLANGGSEATNGTDRAGRLRESDVNALGDPDLTLDTDATTVSRDGLSVVQSTPAPSRRTTPTPRSIPELPSPDEADGVVCELIIPKDVYAGGGATPIPTRIDTSRPAIPPSAEISEETDLETDLAERYTTEAPDVGKDDTDSVRHTPFDEVGNEEVTLPGGQIIHELLSQPSELTEEVDAAAAAVDTNAERERGSGDTVRGYALKVTPIPILEQPSIPAPTSEIIGVGVSDVGAPDVGILDDESDILPVLKETMEIHQQPVEPVQPACGNEAQDGNADDGLQDSGAVDEVKITLDALVIDAAPSAAVVVVESDGKEGFYAEPVQPADVAEVIEETAREEAKQPQESTPLVERVEYTKGPSLVFNPDGTLATPIQPLINTLVTRSNAFVTRPADEQKNVDTETVKAPWHEPETAEPVRQRGYGSMMRKMVVGLVGVSICALPVIAYFLEGESNTFRNDSVIAAQNSLGDSEGVVYSEAADSGVAEQPDAYILSHSDASVDVDLSEAYVQTEPEEPIQTDLVEEPSADRETVIAHLRRIELPQEREAGGRELRSDITLEGALREVPETLSLTTEDRENIRDFKVFVQRHAHASLIEQYNVVTSEGRVTRQVGIVNAFYAYLTDWNGGRSNPEQDRIVFAAFREAGLSFSEICVVNRGEFVSLETIAKVVGYLRDRGYDFRASDIQRPNVTLMTEEDDRNMTLAQSDFELGSGFDSDAVDGMDDRGNDDYDIDSITSRAGLDLSNADLGYSAPDSVEDMLEEINMMQEERDWGVYDSEFAQAEYNLQADEEGQDNSQASQASEAYATLKRLDAMMEIERADTVEEMLAEINYMERERVKRKNSEPYPATTKMHYDADVLERLVTLKRLDEEMDNQYAQVSFCDKVTDETDYCEVNEMGEVVVSQELSLDEQELLERAVREVCRAEYSAESSNPVRDSIGEQKPEPSSSSSVEERPVVERPIYYLV
jgi:hypothetical protein